MNTIFATIDSLEKKKWEFLESEKRSKIEDFMGLNYTSLMKTFDRKQEYSGAKFVYYQSNGENCHLEFVQVYYLGWFLFMGGLVMSSLLFFWGFVGIGMLLALSDV